MSTCNWTDCTTELEGLAGAGRPRKWCAEHRPLAAHASKRTSKRICKVAGCGISHRAKGFCTKHYKQTYGSSIALVAMTCAGCGCTVMREKRAPRYGNTYCSPLCRHWIEWGAWSQPLPTPKPERVPVQPKEQRTYDCAWCGTQCTTTRTVARFCSRTCKHRYYKVKRRAMEANAPGMYTWADVTRLWLTFNRCCAYCLTPTPLTDIQAEHVEPISRGGANNTSNLLPSCGPCNADKRDLTLTAWATDRARRGLPPVHTQWHPTDARYKHLTSRTSLRMSA